MNKGLRATNKAGHVWEGGREGAWWLYIDDNGNLYESTEAPAYRIALDNAALVTVAGKLAIAPKEPKQ